MKLVFFRVFLLILTILVLSPKKALANLCPPEDVLPVHEMEAIELEAERYSLSRALRFMVGDISRDPLSFDPFSSGVTSGVPSRAVQTQELENGCETENNISSPPCYIGTRAYNARVIACNRVRTETHALSDRGQGEAERSLNLRTAEERQFEDDLPRRTITGNLRYFGFAPKWFGYELERVGGTWIVTSTLDFEMPDEDRGFIRLHPYLTGALSTSPSPQINDSLALVECDPDNADLNDDIGLINPNFAECRIPIDTELFLIAEDFEFLPEELRGAESRPAIEWLMLHFRHTLEKVWSRPGFQVKINIANLVSREGEVSREELSSLRANDVVYDVRLHNVDGRDGGTYLPGPFQNSVYYTAISWATISHEFGHALGLDDEYIERREDRNDLEEFGCQLLSGYREGNDPQGEIDDRQAYLMCVNFTPTTDTEDDNAERFGYHSASSRVKAVYPWIITQRYSLGREGGSLCADDDDCDRDEYCERTPFERNECVDKRDIGERCGQDKHCFEGAFCNNKPVGLCEGDNLLEMGSQCNRDAQCVSDKCEGSQCVCRNDHDCEPGNERCATFLFRANECVRTCNTNRDCEDLDLRCGRPLGTSFRRCR